MCRLRRPYGHDKAGDMVVWGNEARRGKRKLQEKQRMSAFKKKTIWLREYCAAWNLRVQLNLCMVSGDDDSVDDNACDYNDDEAFADPDGSGPYDLVAANSGDREMDGNHKNVKIDIGYPQNYITACITRVTEAEENKDKDFQSGDDTACITCVTTSSTVDAEVAWTLPTEAVGTTCKKEIGQDDLGQKQQPKE
ncbi:hypothetical protein C0Q70_20488 [Pomacea canaliculata]|uniref:Uncharacterized protein n=1 Tax=Pomacea canaliculata TaxID=400727 RepID=A0A2T7NFP4_POMCA|nr:hypothetical protein C0Q70_20488 [Pomacea canaliculata]